MTSSNYRFELDELLEEGVFDRAPSDPVGRRKEMRRRLAAKQGDSEGRAFVRQELLSSWRLARRTRPNEGLSWSGVWTPKAWPKDLCVALEEAIPRIQCIHNRIHLREVLHLARSPRPGENLRALADDWYELAETQLSDGAFSAWERSLSRGRAIALLMGGESHASAFLNLAEHAIASGDRAATMAAVGGLRQSSGRSRTLPLSEAAALQAISILEEVHDGQGPLELAPTLASLSWLLRGLRRPQGEVQQRLALLETTSLERVAARLMDAENGIAAGAILQRAVEVAAAARLESEQRLHAMLREANRLAVAKNMKAHRTEIPITEEMRAALNEQENLLVQLSTSDPRAAFIECAYATQVSIGAFQEALEANGPSLLDLVQGSTIVEGNRTGGTTSKGERAVALALEHYRGHGFQVFARYFIRLMETCTESDVQAAVVQSFAAERVDTGALTSGISAHFAGRYIESVYTLVPQIEMLMRELVKRGGGEATRWKKGGQQELVAGDLVNQLESLNVPTACVDWLRICYADTRGLNLRNRLLHGLFPARFINEALSLMVLHGLLLLSAIAPASSGEE